MHRQYWRKQILFLFLRKLENAQNASIIFSRSETDFRNEQKKGKTRVHLRDGFC